jgi:hypothetical protein
VAHVPAIDFGARINRTTHAIGSTENIIIHGKSE